MLVNIYCNSCQYEKAPILKNKFENKEPVYTNQGTANNSLQSNNVDAYYGNACKEQQSLRKKQGGNRKYTDSSM